MRRRDLALLAAATAAGVTVRAQAAWPDRPIQVLIPSPPGGGMDGLTRAVLPFVQPHLPGASFVPINRPGAGGQVAFEAMAAAPPDGYTLGAVPTPVLSTIPMERTTRYRVDGFTFIANVVDDPGAIYVNVTSPHKTITDLVAAARARPGQLAVGTAGIGSDDHLLLLALEGATGTSFSHIPYNGTQPIVTGVLNGDLAAGSFNASEGLGLVRQGALRMLAQGGADRWSAAGEVPTFREQGLEVTGGSTRGFVAPGGLPVEIRDRLRAAFAAGLADPRWAAEAERLSLPLRIMNGEEQQAFYLSEDARLRALWQQRPWREKE